MNGHSDVVGGVVITSDDQLYTKLKFLQNGIGAIPSPFDCFLVMRGIKTLPIRMREHEKNAFEVARFLEKSDKVEVVRYPGILYYLLLLLLLFTNNIEDIARIGFLIVVADIFGSLSCF